MFNRKVMMICAVLVFMFCGYSRAEAQENTVTITAIALPPACVGRTYSQDIAVSGDASSWSVTNGNLPEGLSLDASSGKISGTVPTGAIEHNSRNPKHCTFDVTASNTAGNSDTKTLTIDIYEPAKISSDTFPNAKAGESYDAHIEASGTYIYIWELSPSANIPSWLKYSSTNQHNICDFYGVPSEAGTYTFTVKCGNSYFEDKREFTLTVEPADTTVAITAESLEAAGTGQEYSHTFTASGSPLSWKVTSGDIPEGLTLSGDGTMSGTVSENAISSDSAEGKIYTFDITASNDFESDTETFSLTVFEPVRIITESLDNGKEGEEYSAVIEAAGTRVEFSQDANDIPPGLEADTSQQGKIIITGTPSIKGTYNIRAVFANSWGSEDKLLTLEIEGKSSPSFKPQIIMPEENYSTLIAGQSYSFQFTASGTEPITWSVTGDIPPGLSFDTSTAVLSGTTESLSSYRYLHSPKDYIFTVKASNSGGSDSAEIFMSVCNPPVITASLNLPEATLNNSYSTQITAEGTESHMEWKKLSGSLPKGLTLTMSKNSRFTTITGTPQVTGTFLLSLKVSNYAGESSKNFILKVNADTDPETGKPSINTMSLPEGETGSRYSALVEASGRKPITWSKSGSLPGGLKIDKYGSITGIPKTAGVYNFTLKAKNKDGETKQNFTIRITGEKYSKPKITTKKISDATLNESYSVQLECTGSSPVTWSFANSKYPAGLYITEDGKISGIPKEYGKFSVKVKAENNIGSSSKTYTLKVNGIAPEIITDSLPAGLKGGKYTAQLLAEGTAPIKWSKSGKFPSGLKLSSKTGEITGKPSKKGTYSFTVKAKNKYGEYSRVFAVIVSDAVTDSVSDSVSDSGGQPETFTEMTELQNLAQPYEYAQPDNYADTYGNIDGHNSEIDLCVLSGDEELRGEIYAPEGKPLTFRIGTWPGVKYSGAEVLIADEPVAVEVNDEGIFILPGELVYDEFVIYAEYGGMKTIELYIVAESEE